MTTAAAAEVIEWPRPMDAGKPENLASLLSDLRDYYKRYVVFGLDEQAVAMTLWSMYTHCFAVGQPYSFCPYILITSAEPMSGKSTAMELAAKVVHEPLDAQDVTPALIGRSVGGKTLLLDEIDGVYTGREADGESKAMDLRTILNSGFKRNGTYQRLVKTKGGDFEPKEWPTFGPRALAGIGRRVPDTVQTRSIRLRLTRQTREAPAEKARERYVEAQAAPLRTRMAIAAAQLGELDFLGMPDDLSSRDQGLWEPLFALARRAGGEWPVLAYNAAIELSRSEPVLSLGMQLLQDIRDLFDKETVGFLPTRNLIGSPAGDGYDGHRSATGLCAFEESPWATFTRGRPITPHKVADLLSEYDIKPARDHAGPHGYGPMGYFKYDFETAWKAYIEPLNDASDSSDTFAEE